MAIDVVCDCGKRLKAPDWMAGRGTQCPACWAPVTVPKRGWFGLFGRNSKKRQRKSGPSSTHPLQPAPVIHAVERLLSRRSVARTLSSGRTRPGARQPVVLPQSRPTPTSRKTTFVPTRRVTDGDDYRPNSVMLRSQPRWVKLLPDSSKQHWYSSLLFPFSQLPVFIRLGLLQAVLTTAALIFWLSMERDSPSREQLVLCLIACLGGVFFVMGHTFHYFNAILEMASHGQTKHEPGIGCTALGRAGQLRPLAELFSGRAGLALCGRGGLLALLRRLDGHRLVDPGEALLCGGRLVVDRPLVDQYRRNAARGVARASSADGLDDARRSGPRSRFWPRPFSSRTSSRPRYAIGQLHVTPLTCLSLALGLLEQRVLSDRVQLPPPGADLLRGPTANQRPQTVPRGVRPWEGDTKPALRKTALANRAALVQQHLARDRK